MLQDKKISTLIKYLFTAIKKIINNNPFVFFALSALNTLLLLIIALSFIWLKKYINIFELSLGILLFRIALSLFVSGLWIGYFKLLFNFIDDKPFKINKVFSKFYLLPQIIMLQLIYYCTMIPFLSYLLYKFPYDLQLHGSNIAQYLENIVNNMSDSIMDEVSRELLSAYFNNYDILILLIFCLFPIAYLVKFWCAELLIIDKEYSIIHALRMSYHISINPLQIITLIIIVGFINILAMLMGYIFFTITLTISYLILFIYFRYLYSLSN